MIKSVMFIMAMELSFSRGKDFVPVVKCWLPYSVCYEQCTPTYARLRSMARNDLIVGVCTGNGDCKDAGYLRTSLGNQIECVDQDIMEREHKDNPAEYLGLPRTDGFIRSVKCWIPFSVCYEQCTPKTSRLRGWIRNWYNVAECVNQGDCRDTHTLRHKSTDEVVRCIDDNIMEKDYQDNPNRFRGNNNVNNPAKPDPEKDDDRQRRLRLEAIAKELQALKAREAHEREKARLERNGTGIVVIKKKTENNYEWRYGLLMLGALCLIMI